MLTILESIFPAEHVFNSYFLIHDKLRRPRKNSQSALLDISAVSVYILLK